MIKSIASSFALVLALGALACSEPVVEEAPATDVTPEVVVPTPEVVVPTPEPVVPVVPTPEDPNTVTETKTDASI
jgi:hypothetical protein